MFKVSKGMNGALKNVRFQLRSGPESNWYAGATGSTGTHCVVLACGEPGYDTTNNILKIGDGVTCWENLQSISGGVGPSGNIMRNIGINAYISNADFSGSYDGVSGNINYSVTFYGNSSYYDLTFIYTGPAGTRQLPNNYCIATNNSEIYNNYPLVNPAGYIYGPTYPPQNINRPPQGNSPHYSIYPSFPLGSPSPGVYTVTLNITTANAGGVGGVLQGAFYSTSTTISIGATDPMGPPQINLINSTITQGTPVYVSGIQYYGYGTIVTYTTRGYYVYDIYNILSINGFSFNYITLTDNAGSSIVSKSTNQLQYGSSPYTTFPALSGSHPNTGENYYNSANTVFTINGSNVTNSIGYGVRLQYSLRNALSNTNSGNYYPLNGKTIGYLNSWSIDKETNIPLNQGGRSTISGITSQTRVSIPENEITPLTPTIGNIASFNNQILTKFDPAYNPFDGNFYASSSILTNLNNSYILPTNPSFNSLSQPKNLLIKITNTAPLRAFNLYLGSAAVSVTNVYVYWKDTTNTINYGWYNAYVDWQNPGGCQNGYSGYPYIWQIKMNNITGSNYYNVNAGGGNIYLNIAFTGIIKLSDIVITS